MRAVESAGEVKKVFHVKLFLTFVNLILLPAAILLGALKGFGVISANLVELWTGRVGK